MGSVHGFSTIFNSYKTLLTSKRVLLTALVWAIFEVILTFTPIGSYQVYIPNRYSTGGSYQSVSGLVIFFLVPFLIVLINDEITAKNSSLGQVLANTAGSYIYAVACLLLYIVGIVIGLIAFILPGIFIAVKFFLTFPAVALRDTDPGRDPATGAFIKSWEVSKGNFLGILIAIFGILIINVVIEFIIGTKFGMLTGDFISSILNIVFVIAAVLCYQQADK